MKLLGVVAGVAAAVAVATPAQALSYGTITASADAQIRAAADGGASGGVFKFTDVGPSSFDSSQLFRRSGDPANTFIGICIEVGEYFSGTGTYTVRDVMDAPLDTPGAMGADRAADVAKLVQIAVFGDIRNALNTTLVPTDRLVAFQLALWEITTDRAAGAYDLLSGGFSRADLTGARGVAQGWLTDIWEDRLVGDLAQARGLLALTLPGKQDMLIQTPIPAAAWLLGSGLLGLFGIARRRRTVTA